MSKKQNLGYLGAIFLFFASYTPIMNLPFVGSVTLFQSIPILGWLIFISAIVCAVCVYQNKFKSILIISFIPLITALITFFNFQSQVQSQITGFGDKLNSLGSLFGSSLGDLGNKINQSVSLQWGWSLLIIASVLLVVSSILNTPMQQKLETFFNSLLGKIKKRLKKVTSKIDITVTP